MSFFYGGLHASLKKFRVNAAPATIDSTAALPCGPRRLLIAGARRVSAPSRPDSNQAEADVAKTAFLQAFERPVYPDPRVAEKGKLWRGHSIQGRCQPGRRAVLEETKEPSDRMYSTPSEAIFSRQIFPRRSILIYLFTVTYRCHARAPREVFLGDVFRLDFAAIFTKSFTPSLP